MSTSSGSYSSEATKYNLMYITYYENAPAIQDILTTIRLGGKHNFIKKCQLVIGCNDIFNKGLELKFMKGVLYIKQNILCKEEPIIRPCSISSKSDIFS